jgi:hypothetical protein
VLLLTIAYLYYGKKLQRQKKKKKYKTSTPNNTIVESSTSHDQPENNLQLALMQAPDVEREPESSGATPSPIVEDDEAIDEQDEPTQADLEALEHDPGKRYFHLKV